MSSHEFFVWNGTDVTGPFASELIIELLRSGRVEFDAQIARVGEETWLPITEALSISESCPQASLEREGDPIQHVTIEFDSHEGLLAEAIIEEMKLAGHEVAIEFDSNSTGSRESATRREMRVEHPSQQDVVFGDGYVSINSENFHGQAVNSPSGQFTVAWGGQGYRIFKDSATIARGSAWCIGPAMATDSGLAILAIHNQKARGELLAFGSNGDLHFRVPFDGPIYGFDVTGDEGTVVCVAFSGRASDVFLLGLPGGAIRHQFQLVYEGVVKEVIYDRKLNYIAVHYERNGPVHHYSMIGMFLESESWLVERVHYLDGYQLFFEAEKSMKALPFGPVPEDVVEMLRVALGMQVSPLTKAKIHRRMGEAYERSGEAKKAILHFEKALGLDPMIGVKKRLEGLRSDLSE